MSAPQSIDFSQLLPVFPLPNVVLFPRAILPLHVFEQRYRLMTRDALADRRIIAMALLKPGYEAGYHTLDVGIYPVVCVGRILREERLPDGRYNFVLQGLARARVLAENTELDYRRALLSPLCPLVLPAETERALRQKLRQSLTEPPLSIFAKDAHWLELLDLQDLSLSDVLDLLASVALHTVECKQAFLSEPDAVVRVRCICDVLREVKADLVEQQRLSDRLPRTWPPGYIEN